MTCFIIFLQQLSVSFKKTPLLRTDVIENNHVVIAISVKTKSFKVRSCSNLDKLIHSADSLKSCLPFSKSLKLSVENNTINNLKK